MTTEAKMMALLADAIAEDENGSFDKHGAFTELKGGAYADFAGIMVWAADGAAFQITVTRNKQHDIKDATEEELEGRISSLQKGAIDPQHNAFIDGMRKGYEDALVIHRQHKEAHNDG